MKSDQLFPDTVRTTLPALYSQEGAGEEAQKQNKTGKRETADFHVLTLKMISTTCTH